MASFKLVVPPHTRVINDAHAILSNINSRADELPPNGGVVAQTPIIRLSGVAFMSDVNIVVRHHEDPLYGDE
jgi:hypothetical protein